MKYLINDSEYTKKADIITNNIVDLADLFTINSKNNNFIHIHYFRIILHSLEF